MMRLTSLVAAALLFAVPAMGQTVLAVNASGPTDQVNFVTLQAAETNTAGLVVFNNDIATQAVGNAAGVEQDNNLAFLTLNANGRVRQFNIATAQLARTNTAGVLVVQNDINTSAVGNLLTVDQENDQALAVANLQAGSYQLNFLTLQAAQTNTLGAVVAGNNIATVAAGNVKSIAQTN